jgi:hypothetical protein
LSPWVPAIIAVVTLIIGLVLQGLGYAYFLGRMKEGHESTTRLVESLIRRMEKNDDAALNRAEEKGDLNARLEHVENHVASIGELKTGIVRLVAQFEAHASRSEAGQQNIRTDMSALQRQIQNLMTGAGGSVIHIEPREPR